MAFHGLAKSILDGVDHAHFTFFHKGWRGFWQCRFWNGSEAVIQFCCQIGHDGGLCSCEFETVFDGGFVFCTQILKVLFGHNARCNGPLSKSLDGVYLCPMVYQAFRIIFGT